MIESSNQILELRAYCLLLCVEPIYPGITSLRNSTYDLLDRSHLLLPISGCPLPDWLSC